MRTDHPLNVAAAVVIHKNKVLLARRKGDYLDNLWEFPGGKLERDETAEKAAARELKEELNIDVISHKKILVLEHSYPDKTVRLHFVLCQLDEPVEENYKILIGNSSTGWFIPTQLPLQDLCPADRIAATNISWELFLKDEEYDYKARTIGIGN